METHLPTPSLSKQILEDGKFLYEGKTFEHVK